MLVDRIFRGEAGVREPRAEILRRDLDARARASRRRRECEPDRTRAAAAHGRTRRQLSPCRVASAWRARARADATSRCGARPRYGSTSCDGNGSTTFSDVGPGEPFEARRERTERRRSSARRSRRSARRAGPGLPARAPPHGTRRRQASGRSTAARHGQDPTWPRPSSATSETRGTEAAPITLQSSC